MTETSPLFIKQKLSKSVSIKPNFINNRINESIINILNRTIGGKCSSEGYIKRGSINIIKKSLGQMNLGDTSSSIIYNVTFLCDVCNPIEGNIYKCKVENKNKMGIHAFSSQSGVIPFYVLIPIDYIGEQYDINSINEDDTIFIKVVGKIFKHNDSIIKIIGEIVDRE